MIYIPHTKSLRVWLVNSPFNLILSPNILLLLLFTK
jgi:hypothetical protein